jgi:hypothetical protein
MAEWLWRWTANPLGSARAGSNPVIVACFFLKHLIKILFRYNILFGYVRYIKKIDFLKIKIYILVYI